MSNLFEANAQWSTRPADERFGSLPEMLEATKKYAQAAVVFKGVRLGDLRVEASDQDLMLVGKGNAAKITHHAFGQISALAGAPAGFLRTLPPTLAAQNINYTLKRRDDNTTANLLCHRNGSFVARSINTDNYDRVWNYEIVSRIMDRMDGWRVPPARPAFAGQPGSRPATEADILPNQGDFGLAVKVGDMIAPAGLYASDHDMFAFLVDASRQIWDGQKFLNRGVFIKNSEVGESGLNFKIFTYDNVCGNHIVWGVGKVLDINVRHVKSAHAERGNTFANAVNQWRVITDGQNADIGAMEAGIKAAKAREIAGSKDDVLDALFSFAKAKKLQALTRKTLAAGYEIAEATPRYGSPRTVWGIVNGLTEYSQKVAQGATDDRTDLDVQAGRVMEMAF